MANPKKIYDRALGRYVRHDHEDEYDTRYLQISNNLSDLDDAGTARTNLGLGSIATQDANSVTITGGSVTGITDITIADGGTGASTASGARTNLGLVAGGAGDIWVEKAGDTMTGDLTFADSVNIVANTSTGTKIGTATTQKFGFFDASPVVKQSSLTVQETTITFTEPTTPDYALQDVTTTSPWGFADGDELRTFIGVVENLQVRVSELETRLSNLGLIGSGYGFYASVTVDNTKVSGSSNHTDFPVLINTTLDGTGGEPDIRTVANGGNIENTDSTGGAGGDKTVPADLAFFNDINQTTQYDHEIEKYNATTGEIVVWVRVPTLDFNDDTVFYMHYGDGTVTTSQENVAGVWSSFDGVWHLAESGNGSSDEFKDSTSTNNHGQGGNGTASAVPTQIAAQVGDGQSFDGGDFINCGDMTTFDGATELYMSAWVKQDSLGNVKRIVAKWTGGGSQSFYFANGPTASSEEDEIEFGVYEDASNFHDTKSSGLNLATGTWYHITCIWRGGTTSEIYKNGVESSTYNVAATAGSPTSLANSPEELTFGARWNAGSQDQFLAGDIDEVRISTTAHSADWVLTEYNNQSSPSTFSTIGSETSA